MRMESDFGRYLYALRTKKGLTRGQAADWLGLTARDVAAWESGQRRPQKSHLEKIALLYEVPYEQLLSRRDANLGPQITRIVITGGPCAGKSTALSWIQNAFTAKGYTVLFVPETATELITGGVAPWTCQTNFEYQRCQVKLQIEKEKIFDQAASVIKNNGKVLIVCDRGAIDNKAYMTQDEFTRITEELGTSEVALRDHYDAVFHLVTAAKGAEQFYTKANNQARYESVEEACALDDRLLAAWTGQPHLRVIDNSVDFEDKMLKLISEISFLLGEPMPYEIERKFLIRYPDIEWLERNPHCRKVEITQTYLKSNDGEEIRVRRRGLEGNYVYYLTRKRRITGIRRIEVETRLSKAEYLERLQDADPKRHTLKKTRYCLTWKNLYYEIDLYPFWQDQAIVEVEVSREDQLIQMPEELHVIREVTGEEAFSNAALAAFDQPFIP